MAVPAPLLAPFSTIPSGIPDYPVGEETTVSYTYDGTNALWWQFTAQEDGWIAVELKPSRVAFTLVQGFSADDSPKSHVVQNLAVGMIYEVTAGETIRMYLAATDLTPDPIDIWVKVHHGQLVSLPDPKFSVVHTSVRPCTVGSNSIPVPTGMGPGDVVIGRELVPEGHVKVNPTDVTGLLGGLPLEDGQTTIQVDCLSDGEFYMVGLKFDQGSYSKWTPGWTEYRVGGYTTTGGFVTLGGDDPTGSIQNTTSVGLVVHSQPLVPQTPLWPDQWAIPGTIGNGTAFLLNHDPPVADIPLMEWQYAANSSLATFALHLGVSMDFVVEDEPSPVPASENWSVGSANVVTPMRGWKGAW